MTVLSDRSIKAALESEQIVIEPLDTNCIQPASVDVKLDNTIRVFRSWTQHHFIDVKKDQSELTELIEFNEDNPFLLHPGNFILGSTLEWIEIAADLVARLEGKSSLGRIGLLIHSTAGYIDPGWKGQLTLELSNVSNLPIMLYPKMKIAQLSFMHLSTEADRPYGSEQLNSKYQGQTYPKTSQLYREYN